MRFHLTTRCQVCGYSCGSAEQLRLHLYARHADDLQETQHLKELLQWCLFMDLGCFCNPSDGWGACNHECIGLTQLALIVNAQRWSILLPWAFSSADLTTVLDVLLPSQVVHRVAMALITRNFQRIWQDYDLLRMLSNNCLLCQEAVPLHRITAHLVAAHRITENRVKLLTLQLCTIYANLATEGSHCEWCHAVLPCRIEDDQLIEYPEEHLFSCPMVVQMAVLLMMPVWSKPDFVPMTWPSHEAIAAAQRQEELKLWQFNALHSDTYGQSMDLLAQWGLTFLQDSAIANSVSFQCLSCQKKFFIPMRFVQHLQQDHNYKQMHTLLCYHRLSLHHPLPCSFCGSSEHQAQCHALLNLAVFLTNGFGPDRGGGDRRCFQDLGPSAHFRAAASLRHERRSEQTQQEAQSRHQEEGSEITIDLLNDNITRAHEHSDQTGAETRGQSEHSLAGERISTAFEPGKGSILPLLLQQSQIWHKSDRNTCSLRHVLAQTMMQTLDARLTTLQAAKPGEALFQECMTAHLVLNDAEKSMPFLRWSSQQKCLLPAEKAGIPMLEVARSVSNILRLMKDSSVTLRFHSLKKAKDGTVPQPVPWLWTVSLRNSPELWHELVRLSHHAIWQLIQVRLKPQTLARQPLAAQLQKAL